MNANPGMGWIVNGRSYPRKENMYKNLVAEMMNMVRYHLPCTMLQKDKEMLGHALNNPNASRLILDPRYYTLELSKEEKEKQRLILSNFKDQNNNWQDNILKDLMPSEIKVNAVTDSFKIFCNFAQILRTYIKHLSITYNY